VSLSELIKHGLDNEKLEYITIQSKEGIAMLKPRVIVFAGTVGAGKSTQMRLTSTYLSQKGAKVRRTYLKGFHMLSYVFAWLVAKCLRGTKKHMHPLTVIHQRNQNLERKLLKLMLLLDFIEVLLLDIVKVFIPLKLGYYVLVEEYAVGYVANHLHYRLINPDFYDKYGSKMIKILIRILSSRPLMVFFLDAPDEELRRRWKRRGSPAELNSYLNALRESLKLIKNMGVKVIYVNTDQPVPKTFRLIVKYVEQT